VEKVTVQRKGKGGGIGGQQVQGGNEKIGAAGIGKGEAEPVISRQAKKIPEARSPSKRSFATLQKEEK